jgi:hypothetical protein
MISVGEKKAVVAVSTPFGDEQYGIEFNDIRCLITHHLGAASLDRDTRYEDAVIYSGDIDVPMYTNIKVEIFGNPVSNKVTGQVFIGEFVNTCFSEVDGE